jgi:hypothetical protein
MPAKRFAMTILALLFLFAVLSPAAPAGASEIMGPQVRIDDNNIVVSSAIRLDEKQLREIESGIPKEITIYVDLFRVWDSWPDEFVLGKTLTQTLRCDPVKKEYIATSLSGTTLKEKRFRECGPLLDWALSVNNLHLTNTSELEPAEYFVKVTAESHIRRLPPIIKSLFFFIRETEFSVSKDSSPFEVDNRR